LIANYIANYNVWTFYDQTSPHPSY